MAEGFVSHESEGESFFGLLGNAELSGSEKLDRSERSFELSHEEGIASATAGDDELGNFRFGQNETVESIHDAEGSEDGGGADKVFGAGAKLAAVGQNFCDEGAAKIFAAGRFWRLKFKVRIAKKLFKKRNDALAAKGEPRAGVEALAALREVRDESVNEHVGGTSVEGEDILRASAGGDDGDVGDAAEIQRDTGEFLIAVEEIVGEGNERRALAAGGHVGWTEVGDGGDASEVRNDRTFTDLEGGRCGLAKEGDGRALMEDRLAVAADEVNLPWRDVKFLAGGEGGFGEELAEAEVELADFGGRDGNAFGDLEDFGADGFGDRKGCVIDELGVQVRRST